MRRLIDFVDQLVDLITRSMTPWLNPQRIRVYPIGLSIIAWGGWLISLWRRTGILDGLGQAIGNDFMAFYTGGHFLLNNQMDQLYKLSAQRSFQESLGVPVQTHGFYPFINPPFATLMYAPFATGAYLPGLFAWWSVQAICFVLAIRLLRREFLVRQNGQAQPAPASMLSSRNWILYGLLFYPTIAWIMYGQITGFLLLIFVGAYILLRQGRDFAAGALWGVLLFKPQLAITLVVVLFVKGRWRALLGGAVTTCAWLAGGFVIGWQSFGQYLQLSGQLMDLLRLEIYDSWGLHNFYGFSILLLNDISPALTLWLTYFLMATALIAISWSWYRNPWQPGRRKWDMLMAATFVVSLLISPHLYLYDLMLLLLPFAIIWFYHAESKPGVVLDGGPVLALTALVYMLTFAGSYLSLLQWDVAALIGLPKIAIQFSVPCLAMWVYVILKLANAPEAGMLLTTALEEI